MNDAVILVTGITGFVGGALAARLVAKGRSVVAVVRAETREHATVRVAHSLSRFLGSREGGIATGSVQVLIGDLTVAKTYDCADFDGVTHVVHAAACTSFASRREVWRANVDGMRNLASRMLESRTLRRFLHVSTAYCCGDRPSLVVHEDDAPQAEHGHVNEYTRSKASAELSLSGMGWGDRLIVARPSVVIGHSDLGIRPSSSLFWYYRAMAALRCGPFELDDHRDVVPVDYVAEALEFLLMREQPRFTTYHVSAGFGGSEQLRDILRRLSKTDVQDEWRRLSASALGGMHEEIRRLVRDEEEARKLARGLAACAKFGELGVQFFDNGRLLSEGFRAPPRFSDYLPQCLESCGDATIFEQMIDDA